MPRGRKKITPEVENVPTEQTIETEFKTNVSNESANVKNLEKENKQLKNELDEIKKMLMNLMINQQPQTNTEPQQVEEAYDEEEVEIKQNKYIKVMSLYFGKLVLTTDGKGRGKAFVFDKFGDVRNIVYSDLANLIHHQQSFAEKGLFYVFDKQVVKNHGLIEYYNKFLTKEAIDNILEHNRDEVVNLFNNTTEAQRETIINILIKKIVDGEDVDINKVDVISRIYGKNIYDIARDKINIMEEK